MKPRHAFTLVEVMAAMALGTFVLVTAISAFRVISQAIAVANAVSTENSLLRSGFHIAFDDADFWLSNASSDPPYQKAEFRDRPRSNGDGRTEWKRPFQPITFQAATGTALVTTSGALNTIALDGAGGASSGTMVGNPYLKGGNRYDPAAMKLLNPNVLLPHDPRSFQRMGFYSRQPKNANVYGGPWDWDPSAPVPAMVWGNYALFGATDMRGDPANSDLMQAQDVPIREDGAVLPVTDQTLPAAMAKLPPDLRANPTSGMNLNATWNQNLSWRLWSRISYVGSVSYLPPGQATVPYDQRGFVPSLDAGYRNGALLPSPWADWMQNCNGSAHMKDDFPTHDSPNRLGRIIDEGALAMVFPAIFDGKDDLSWACYMDQETWDKPFMPVLRFYDYGDESSMWRRGEGPRNDYFHTSETVRIPYNVTDVNKRIWSMPGKFIDMVNKPKNMPTLTTSILRYQKMGGADVVLCRVRVENRVLGKMIDMTFTPFATNYQGARQHWRLTCPNTTDPVSPGAGEVPIGDFYVR